MHSSTKVKGGVARGSDHDSSGMAAVARSTRQDPDIELKLTLPIVQGIVARRGAFQRPERPRGGGGGVLDPAPLGVRVTTAAGRRLHGGAAPKPEGTILKSRPQHS